MKVIYIAHKISGDLQNNINKVKEIVANMNRNSPDLVPFAPYLVDLWVLNDDIPEERERGMKNNEHYFKCGFIDELWIFSDVSEGIKKEIEWASLAKIKIKFV